MMGGHIPNPFGVYHDVLRQWVRKDKLGEPIRQAGRSPAINEKLFLELVQLLRDRQQQRNCLSTEEFDREILQRYQE